jgi:pyrimidine operon attenuation protein/uracil phosphoribosyltransferase
VRKAMASSENHPMREDEVNVDEMVVGGEEGVRGRQNQKKKLVVVGIEKKGKGISDRITFYIEGASAQEFK